MTSIERHRDDDRRQPAPEPGGENEALRDARSRGEDLLAAGDAAVARALSRDSSQFLIQTRQEGGQ